jgi:hypothetical protein
MVSAVALVVVVALLTWVGWAVVPSIVKYARIRRM